MPAPEGDGDAESVYTYNAAAYVECQGVMFLARSALGSAKKKRSPGFITRGFLCFGARTEPRPRPSVLRYYAAFASVVTGAGVVVGAGIVASIGTTFPFPIRLAEFHAAKIFGSFAAALFT